MHPNEEIIRRFYTAFDQKDYVTMQNCYTDDIVFNDEVFVDLHGKRAKAMWHMLLSREGKLALTFDNVKADNTNGSCTWIAQYNFSKTGRPVVNVISANFIFSDGKIVSHTDIFDFWKWSSMAFGVSGKLLGWSSFLKNKVRDFTKKALDTFISKNPQYQD